MSSSSILSLPIINRARPLHRLFCTSKFSYSGGITSLNGAQYNHIHTLRRIPILHSNKWGFTNRHQIPRLSGKYYVRSLYENQINHFSSSRNDYSNLSSLPKLTKPNNDTTQLSLMKKKAANFFNNHHLEQQQQTNNPSTLNSKDVSHNNLNLLCNPSQNQIQEALKLMRYFHNHTARDITINLQNENDPIHANSSPSLDQSSAITYSTGAQLCDHILRTIVPYAHMSIPVDEFDLPTSIIRMHILTIQAYTFLAKNVHFSLKKPNKLDNTEKSLKLQLESPQMAEAVLRNLMSIRLLFPTSSTEGLQDTTEISQAIDITAYSENMKKYEASLLVAFNSTLEAYAKCGGGRDSAQRAEDLLTRMRHLYNQSKGSNLSGKSNPETLLFCCHPDTISFNTVIYAWSQINNPSFTMSRTKYTKKKKAPSPSLGKMAAERTESILNLMFELESKGSTFNIAPNVLTVNTVIFTWSRSNAKEAPIRATAILDNMIDGHLKGSTGFFPNVYTFSALINTWAQSKRPDAAQKANDLLERMKKLHSQWYDDVEPNSIVLNSVLNAWEKHHNSKEAYNALIEHMKDVEHPKEIEQSTNNSDSTFASSTLTTVETIECSSGLSHTHSALSNSKILPDVETYGKAILILEKCAQQIKKNRNDKFWSTINPAEKAEEYLKSMLDLYERKHSKSSSTSSKDFENSLTFYLNRAINTWLSTGLDEAPTRVEKLLQISLNHPHMEPDEFTYARVIRAWSKSGQNNAPLNSYRILMEMEKDFVEGKTEVAPDSFCYNNVLYAFSQKKQTVQAEKLLSHMEKLKEKTQEKIIVRPDMTSYLTLLSAYTNSNEGKKYVIPKVEALMKRMQERQSEDKGQVFINTMVLNMALKAYGQGGDEESSKKALHVLQRMEKLHESGENKHVRPDFRTYTILVNALDGHPDAVQEIKKVLKRIDEKKLDFLGEQKPDAIFCNTVINVLASHDTEEAMDFLNGMKDTDVNWNEIDFEPLIISLCEQTGNSGSKEAEILLHNMIKLYHNGKSNKFPTIYTISAVVNNMALKSDDAAAQKMDEILTILEKKDKQGIQKLAPTAGALNGLLRTLEQTRSAEKAEEILERFVALRKNRQIRFEPESLSYKHVFNAWIRSGNNVVEKKAFNFYRTIQRKHPSLLGLTDYHAIMLKYAYSDNPDRIEIISNIFTDLKKKKDPGQKTYGILLRACQKASYMKPEELPKEKANLIFELASQAFKNIIESPTYEKDDKCFAIFLRCCIGLLPDDDQNGVQASSRERVVTALFQKTCDEGLVSEFVLSRLMSDKLLSQKLLGFGHESAAKDVLKNLPDSWSHNVPSFEVKVD